MKTRVGAYLGGTYHRDMEVCTFHSFCYRYLRKYAKQAHLSQTFALLTPSLKEALLENFLDEQNIDFPIKYIKRNDKYDFINKHDFIEKSLSYIERQKNDVIRPVFEVETQYFLDNLNTELHGSENYLGDLCEIIYACYEYLRQKAGVLDFEDLINYMADLCRQDQKVRSEIQQHFRYIFVDEFQDTNKAQYELLLQLKGPHNYVCVVGDDDQSIYGWRGARIENFASLRDELPQIKLYELTINYRSTCHVLDFSNALIIHKIGRAHV